MQNILEAVCGQITQLMREKYEEDVYICWA